MREQGDIPITPDGANITLEWSNPEREARVIARAKSTGYVTGTKEDRDPHIIPEPPLRARLLQDGIDLTLGSRNRSYGDPLTNFDCTSALKQTFWGAMIHSGKKAQQNSAFGHSIDMVLTNLARIACSPTTHLERDRFLDGANYLAIAYEVGTRSEQVTSKPSD